MEKPFSSLPAGMWQICNESLGNQESGLLNGAHSFKPCEQFLVS